MTDPDPYHTLSATDRDHLLAAAWVTAERDTLPAGAAVGRAVGTLTGDEPDKNTTARSLGRLVDAGLIERDAAEPAGAAQGVRVTDAGHRALRRGAARLDAAATVGADAATALADATGRDREAFDANDKDVPELDELDSALKDDE